MTAESYTLFSAASKFRIAILSSIIIAVSLIMAATPVTITANYNDLNLALAQTSVANTANITNTANVDTFRAKGQISSLASDTLAGRPSSNTSEMWVLGGDWELGVEKGNLTNLAVDITM